jgi:putative colanic acid biosynthesis UDP-glucose lipid carrier transferase
MPRILRLLRSIIILLDVFSLNASLMLSYFLFFGNSIQLFKQALPYVMIINLGWLFVQAFFKIYDNFLYRNSVSIFRRTINAYVLFGFCLSVVFTISLQNEFFSLFYSSHIYFYLLSLGIFAVFLFVNRVVVLAIRKNSRLQQNPYRKNIVIVGQNPSSRTLSLLFSEKSYSDYNIMGIFYDEHLTEREEVVDTLYRGTTTECIPFMRNNKVDEIFCTLPGVSKEHVNILMHEADRNLTRFRLVPDYYEYLPGTVNIEMIDNIPVLSGRTEPLEDVQNAIFKRIFDITFSLLVIVFLLSWLLPIIALLIKLESKGPVFFKQLRSGRSNEPFYCLKFRSMTVNEHADKMQATKNDKRITRLGAFLRKTSLDELPQFFNVLIGNMSIVGPRPHMLSHTEQYAALIDKFMVRHFLKPGITGWAQVSGLRGETRTTEDMARRVEADVWYLENWSFLLDMKIIFLTVWNIVKGDEKAF